jgi:hypothetical protein
MKSTSHYAMAAAAGLFVGAMAFTPAKAADLGGDCCADLEERVAELEATTVRKGNRVVSVQLYGQVNRALLYWDDGIDSDVYEVDGDASGTRIGVRGSGTLKAGVEAGYRIEWELQPNDSSDVSQFNHEGDGLKDSIAVRQANVYLEGQYGRVTLGQQSSALDGVAQVNLGGTFALPDSTSIGGFLIRNEGPDGNYVPGLTYADVIFDGDGGRNNGIRYDSPSLAGFILSAFWGEDDLAQVALRFSKEWNSIRLAAAIGYGNADPDLKTDDPLIGFSSLQDRFDDELEWYVGSISAMHVPSGIFATFSAHDSELSYGSPDDDVADLDRSHWYIQGGVNRNFTGMGSTRIFGEYGQYETNGSFAVGNVSIIDPETTLDDVYARGDIDTDVIGFGVEQSFDSAATDVYLHFRHYDVEVKGNEFQLSDREVDTDPEDVDVTGVDPEDFFSVMSGMRVQF